MSGAGNSSSEIFVGAYGSGNGPVISGAEIIQNPIWQKETINGVNTIKTFFRTRQC